ncbi:MAG: Poly(A) polymerase I [Candidatus Anoxychlamydiales bacterium]|nr:Poly(A) polymerase I [Candidatus Anoxychlamydiales bacterium]
MRPPKVYSIDEHLLPINKIDTKAYYVIEKLRVNGFLSFLVGGSVRDLLLKQVPKDFDIATSAKPEEIKKIFKRNCILIGKRFRLAHIRFGKKIIEVSTFRAGDAKKEELILQDNIYGTPEKDVLRRDFTINGLFYDPEVQTVIDYVDGYTDLQKKILRTIGEAKLRFIQDPVRMIRLLKFKARFDFEIEKETLNALIECKQEIVKSSPARILEELFRMLVSTKSKNFFKLLDSYNFLDYLMPELSDFLKINNTLVFTLLEKADLEISKNSLPRSVLISCLIYPYLEMQLKEEFIDKDIFVHLGIVIQIAKESTNAIFRPFFQVPKKLKVEIISILTNQFRFTPINNSKKFKRLKIPRDPCFFMSLQFFRLRCLIDTNLSNIYHRWLNAYESKKIPKKIQKVKENEL